MEYSKQSAPLPPSHSAAVSYHVQPAPNPSSSYPPQQSYPTSLQPYYGDGEASYNPTDDYRADCNFRAWGSRRVRPATAASSHATAQREFHMPGAVNPRSLRTIAKLPRTAHRVDPVYRSGYEPKRAAGGWSFLAPYHEQYQFYRSYGNAGQHALSSHYHNFPMGAVPKPERVYGDRAQCRNTKVVNTRPKVYAHAETMTTVSIPKDW